MLGHARWDPRATLSFCHGNPPRYNWTVGGFFIHSGASPGTLGAAAQEP